MVSSSIFQDAEPSKVKNFDKKKQDELKKANAINVSIVN